MSSASVSASGAVGYIGRQYRKPCEVPQLHRYPLDKCGKVRDIYNPGYSILAMVHSNRLSSFDRAVCNVPWKGTVLNLISQYWFEQTRHIMPNHFLHAKRNLMVVKKCEVIPVEVVLRAYITGSTATSLWTHYNQGERVYCGIEFPDGLVKNQRLDRVVITPTTKNDVHDEPVSAEEVVERGLASQEEWDYIADRALALFDFASQRAAEAGFILVDTKLEFGREEGTGRILLIDEAFTCDSSRYWDLASYQERFQQGEEPMKTDKDLIRDYLIAECKAMGSDPYQMDQLPIIPSQIMSRVQNAYADFYQRLNTGKTLCDFGCDQDLDSESELESSSGDGLLINWDDAVLDYLSERHSPAVLILGSDQHEAHIQKLKSDLETVGIYSIWEVCSAYEETERLLELLAIYRDQIRAGRRLVVCCISGGSNALGAITACNLEEAPVISVPPFSDKSDYLVNIHSSLQNPYRVPVATILDPGNAALFVKRLFTL